MDITYRINREKLSEMWIKAIKKPINEHALSFIASLAALITAAYEEGRKGGTLESLFPEIERIAGEEYDLGETEEGRNWQVDEKHPGRGAPGSTAMGKP